MGALDFMIQSKEKYIVKILIISRPSLKLLFRCKGIEPHSFIQININTLQPIRCIDYTEDENRKYFQIEKGPNDIQYDNDENKENEVLDLSEFEKNDDEKDENK